MALAAATLVGMLLLWPGTTELSQQGQTPPTYAAEVRSVEAAKC
jgi:hypothetical protein